MAKITCTEWRRLSKDADGNLIPVLEEKLATQAALSAPSATIRSTAAFGADTKYARLGSDVALHVAEGASATTDDDYYSAGAEIVRRVSAGQILSYILG